MFHNRIPGFAILGLVLITIFLGLLYLSCSTHISQLRIHIQESEGRIEIVSERERESGYEVDALFLVNSKKSCTGENQ